MSESLKLHIPRAYFWALDQELYTISKVGKSCSELKTQIS